MSFSMCWADSLEADGHSAGQFTYPVGKLSIVLWRVNSQKAGGEMAGWPSGKLSYLGDLPLYFVAGKMTARARLRSLTALEMKRLHLREQVFGEAELGRSQLIEVARVLGLFLWQHSAFAGADAGAGQFRAAGHGNLGLFRQGTEAHVRDEDRDVEMQRLLGVGTDRPVPCPPGRPRATVGRQLRRENLNVVPLRQRRSRDAHRCQRSVMSSLFQAIPCQGVNQFNGWFFRGVLTDWHAIRIAVTPVLQPARPPSVA